MNTVAGPKGRYELLSRRWMIFGLTGVIGTFIVTRVIDLIDFPYNYSMMFLVLSMGGFFSFYFSRKIQVPDSVPPPLARSKNAREGIQNYLSILRANPQAYRWARRSCLCFWFVKWAPPIRRSVRSP
jgi:hypothetical protein